MVEYQKFLTPIEKELPSPPHTHIHPRCFTCSKWPVCTIREDYLKTAQLMEEVLGCPSANYELHPLPIPMPEFDGETIEELQEYFPEKVTSKKDKTGNFYVAKMVDIDTIKFMYIFDGYYVFFVAKYNKETTEYDIEEGMEICYHLQCILNEESLDDIQLGLLSFREDYVPPTEKNEDVINTTFFSAELNCKFYEWEKGLSYEDGIKRIIAHYPCGVPIDDCGHYYHLATFHKEPHRVPCYHPENGSVSFAPMPYPVYIPSPCKKCKPLTRDELNEI